MAFVSSRDLRENLAKMLDKVIATGEPLTVIRAGGKGNAIIMPEAEFANWQETIRVLRLPQNAKRLLRAIEADEAARQTEAAD